MRDLVRKWDALLRARGVEHEILLVDDGSTDRTVALAEELATSLAALKVLRHETRRGAGVLLRTGLAAARLPLVAYAPCDPAYEPVALTKLLAEIDRVHFVSGLRAGRRVPWPWRQAGRLWRLGERIVFGPTAAVPLPGWLGWRRHVADVLARVFFGVRLRDAGCPFKLFRREILARAPIQSDGDFAHVELLAKVNFAISWGNEVPLPIKAPPGPPPKGSLRQLLRDACRVFSRPDFGPSQLQDVCPPCAGPTPSAPQ
ncbi:MAG: glycosyltransferase family 2 protein [Planctomycetes bacterium]|nr:glycosyltransferase family 2 protein [Planctomycetota bacterium]